MTRPTACLALVALVACGKNDPDSATPTGSLPTATTTTTDTGTITAPKVELMEGPQITCAFPSARANGYYERRTAPHPPADGAYTWGGGVIATDINVDGTLDLVAATQAGLQLWVTRPSDNPADISFDEVAGGLAGIELDYAVGGTAVDIDGDGDEDLIISRWERPNRLLINQGDHYTDGTPAAWNARSWKTQSASVADMDGDGDLDVFFGSYGEKPDTFDDPTMPPADPAELYRNDDGSFTDVSDTLPAAAHDGYTFASGWWNVSGNPELELVIANDFGKVRPTVALSNGPNGWTVNSNFHPDWEDMGMAVADLNGDAVADFLFSSWKTASVLASGANYGDPGIYVETSTAWGIQADVENRRQVYGWGTAWGDLDNDADQDAMILYGYWSTYTEEGDPPNQIDALYEQTGLLSFTQRGGEPEWQVNDSTRGRGLVFADLNDDGYLDIIKGHPETASVLYLSRCGSNSWVRVRLQQNGMNRDAIGARIDITTGGYTQSRWIHAGSSGMYGGDPLEVHFGLGGAEIVDRMQIHWPDGKTSTFEGVNPRRVITAVRNNTP